jgi:hypothetical protein
MSGASFKAADFSHPRRPMAMIYRCQARNRIASLLPKTLQAEPGEL